MEFQMGIMEDTLCMPKYNSGSANYANSMMDVIPSSFHI